jgi:hypothetical protein
LGPSASSDDGVQDAVAPDRRGADIGQQRVGDAVPPAELGENLARVIANGCQLPVTASRRVVGLRDTPGKQLPTAHWIKADMLITTGCGDECPHVPSVERDWPLDDPKGQPI